MYIKKERKGERGQGEHVNVFLLCFVGYSFVYAKSEQKRIRKYGKKKKMLLGFLRIGNVDGEKDCERKKQKK